MKISYNWLKEYLPVALPAEEAAAILTDIGLEVESVERHESIKGGLKGIVTGEVKTKEKHPDADRLSVTTVDIGAPELLHIVCGAPNVAAGQKVVVATVGATLHPVTGESFQIKKSKIRGQVSEGMICAEDEIGVGISHEGIIVLPPDTPVGLSASEIYHPETDYIFEIGLTPNRADAASHIGVARDLSAALRNSELRMQNAELRIPSVADFNIDNTNYPVEVVVENKKDCPRYSGLTISGIKVTESPAWLKNRLLSIGLRPINNIVDVTNFVLHELGQPLHAFDADKIKGKKVIVKNLPEGTVFKTLDEAERKLSGTDLMICNAEEGMCIAGVFGGASSGVTEATQNIFLESAYFNPVSIRKTSRHHGLKTDASFRYERGADPNITVYALKRAALLIKEIAGGEISSEVTDIYAEPVKDFEIDFSYKNCERLIGKSLPKETIKSILGSLDIRSREESGDSLKLSVPPYRVDVTREVDVVEEILRIYGYNNIEVPQAVRMSLSYSQKPDKEKIKNAAAALLSGNGFNEIINNSLTGGSYYDEDSSVVSILNPLSSDLDVLRKTLLFGGLEAIAYNKNRKNADLKLFEFGKTYHFKSKEGTVTDRYAESQSLALFLTGRKQPEQWNSKSDKADFYLLKGYIDALLERLNLQPSITEEAESKDLEYGLTYLLNKKAFIKAGKVKRQLLKDFDIDEDVFYADIDWETAVAGSASRNITYREVPKFPAVRRDLALLLDKKAGFAELEKIAYETEKQLLKEVNLFDVYEGKNIEPGKKSYAVSFILQDPEKTLTDKQIEKVMERLQKSFEEKLGAKLRQ